VVSTLDEASTRFCCNSEDNPSEINLKRLANLLQIKQTDLAHALEMQDSAISKKPYAPNNQVLKQWLNIFNLIIKIIESSEPTLTAEQVKIKMQRWLKMPRPEFNSQSALDFMLNGKARKVRNLLEQRLA
jgi:hypothetical protein